MITGRIEDIEYRVVSCNLIFLTWKNVSISVFLKNGIWKSSKPKSSRRMLRRDLRGMQKYMLRRWIEFPDRGKILVQAAQHELNELLALLTAKKSEVESLLKDKTS